MPKSVGVEVRDHVVLWVPLTRSTVWFCVCPPNRGFSLKHRILITFLPSLLVCVE
jgi:hypothetical protein